MKSCFTKPFVTLLTLLIIPASSLANDNIYVGAGLAIEGVEDAETGVALVLNVGMPIIEDFGSGTITVEGEITHSIVEPWFDGYYAIDVTVNTLGIYGTYIFDINENVYLKPRVGLVYKSLESGYTGEYNEIIPAVSIGGAYKISDTIDIFTDIKVAPAGDVDMVGHLTVGAYYYFN